MKTFTDHLGNVYLLNSLMDWRTMLLPIMKNIEHLNGQQEQINQAARVVETPEVAQENILEEGTQERT